MTQRESEWYREIYRSDLFTDQVLQSILTIVQDGITFLSRDLRVLYANPALNAVHYGRADIAKKRYDLRKATGMASCSMRSDYGS